MVATFIMRALGVLAMAVTIYLGHELSGGAVEVGDVRAQGMLPSPEMLAFYPPPEP